MKEKCQTSSNSFSFYRPKFFLDVLSQHVSAWLIVMMSHERYQAMNSPYTYNSTFQNKNAFILAFVWLVGCVISGKPSNLSV